MEKSPPQFKSSNVANTLLQTLEKLFSQGARITITKETANLVSTLIDVCIVLVDSAESVAESTGDPESRDKTFAFANKIKEEMKKLEGLKKQLLEEDPTQPAIKSGLLKCTRAISDLICTLSTSNENILFNKVTDAAKDTGYYARVVVTSIDMHYHAVFISSCKKFGECSLALTKLLQDVAKESKDKKHKQKVINAILEIKDLTPQILRSAKFAFDDHKDKEKQSELKQIAAQLANKIAYAISVAQPDGGQVQSEISSNTPTIPLQVVSFQIPDKDDKTPDTTRTPRRRRTITDSVLGAEVLKRVRTATLTRMIEQTIGGFTDGEEDEKKEPIPIPEVFKTPQEKQAEESESEELFSAIESDLDAIENDLDFLDFEPKKVKKEETKPPSSLSRATSSSSLSNSSDSYWKSKYDELRRENTSLKLQNENLLRIIEDLTGRKV